MSTGKRNLILICQVLKGNPSDHSLYLPTIEQAISVYSVVPRDSVIDGATLLYPTWNMLKVKVL